EAAQDVTHGRVLLVGRLPERERGDPVEELVGEPREHQERDHPQDRETVAAHEIHRCAPPLRCQPGALARRTVPSAWPYGSDSAGTAQGNSGATVEAPSRFVDIDGTRTRLLECSQRAKAHNDAEEG